MTSKNKAPTPVCTARGASVALLDGSCAKHSSNPAAAQYTAAYNGAEGILAALRVKAPHWLRGNPDIGEAIADEVERLLAVEGLAAMEMPRSAACAHEAGHAVVNAALGLTVTRVEIVRNRRLERATGLAVWGGFTTVKSGTWSITPNTPTEDVCRRICIIAAGLAAEHVLDPSGVRRGSSLDELVTAQAMAAMLHNREQYDGHPRQTFNACWGWVGGAIKANEDVARDLVRKLDLMGSVQGKPLADILRQVRRVPTLIERCRGGDVP